MTLLEPRVVVFENNATRAELYERWLSGLDVRIAGTASEALEVFDETVAVALVDEDFGDGAAEGVLEMVRSGNPDCRVLTTAEDRERVCPALDVDHHIPKPIFEDELREKVGSLVRSALYGSSLKRYYALTIELTSVEVGEDDEMAEEHRERLEGRVESLKARLDRLTRMMDAEDFHATLEELKPVEPEGQVEALDSKYVPRKCPNCDRTWGGDEPEGQPIRLGSFVWRCADCGHVQMHGDPNEGQLAHTF